MFRGGLDAARVAGPACLLVLVALSGCTTGDSEEPDDAGTLKTEVFDDDTATGKTGNAGGEEPVATTVGRVEGVVLHASGFTLSDAQVTILSVDHSVVTDDNGTFAFAEVEAGEQVLRVERETYKTLQKPFEVVAGKVSKVEVVLTPADQGGFAEHTHNHHWRGLDTYEVFGGTLQLDDDIYEVPPGCTTIKRGTSPCSYLDIQPEEGRIVPPGTSKVVVEIEFEPGPFFEAEETMYFRMYPPRDAEGKAHSFRYQVESGSETIEYELPGPAMYDHGHAKWTDWAFQIDWTAGYGDFAGVYYNHLFRSPVDVTITAHKGEVALDPPHERYWAEGDRLELEFSDPAYAWCPTTSATCGTRSANPDVWMYSDGSAECRYGCMALKRGNTVPPGTTRVEFTVEHYWGDEATAPQAGAAFEKDDFIIGYKTAAAPPNWATWDDYTWLEPVETTEEDDRVVWKYEVDVAEEETDPFYQKNSNWILMAAVPGYEDADSWEGMECVQEACGRAYFHLLEFVAINDDRDEMMEG